jgi:hypothetical protein
MIDYKKDFEIDKLSISEPIKNGNNWEMKCLYDNVDLCFQTPAVKLDKEKLTLSFDCHRKHPFFKFIDDLENNIVEYLHKNSERLFKVKSFSKSKLRDGLISSWDISDEGRVVLDCNDCIKQDTIFLSTFNEDVTFEKLSKNVLCLFCLETVNFSKDKFELKYRIKIIKSKKLSTGTKELVLYNPVKDDNLDFFNE